MQNITPSYRPQPPQPADRLVLYCSCCRSTTSFVREAHTNEWVCVGNPNYRREGCGKRMRARQ